MLSLAMVGEDGFGEDVCGLNCTAVKIAAQRELMRRGDAAKRDQQRAFKSLANSRLLQNQLDVVLDVCESEDKAVAFWADAAVLDIAQQKNASPEVRERANLAIDSMWKQADRKLRLIKVAVETQNHYLDDRILQLTSQPDSVLAETVQRAVKRLRIAEKMNTNLPRIESIGVDASLQQFTLTSGDVARGQQLFKEANCVACHTVSKDAKQQGPYLDNIAAT